VSEVPATDAATGLSAHLLELLEAIRAGEVDPGAGLDRLARMPYDELAVSSWASSTGRRSTRLPSTMTAWPRRAGPAGR
jgi:hypothetical protein